MSAPGVDQGLVLLRGWANVADLVPLRGVCDTALAAWRAQQDGVDGTNLAYLTDARWYAGTTVSPQVLLEWIASERVTALLTPVLGPAFVLHNTQYFPEPVGRSWIGAWHRDCQYLVASRAEEHQVRAELQAWHLRIAFVDDDHLEVVPGSAPRADTADEAQARATGDARELPGAQRVSLRAGDAVLFHAWSIHRGRYVQGPSRRSLDVIIGDRRCDRCPADAFPAPIPAAGLSARAAALVARSGLLAPS